MEIFNNIGMALSMPNEGLIDIIYIPIFFVESSLCLFLIMQILNKSFSTKQKLSYIILSAFEGIISMKFIPNPFNIFTNYIFIYLLAYKVLSLSWIESFLGMIIPPIIFALTGSLISNPFLRSLQISSDQLSTIPIYRLSYMSLMYSLVFIITLALKYKKLKIEFVDDIDKKTIIITTFNLILGITTIIIQSIILFYYIDTLPIIITFLSFISLFAYFIISIYSISRIMKLTLTTKKLQSAEEYNNTLRILHDNVRGFKHDFDNIVTTIGGYIRTNDMKGLENYYVQLEDDCQRVNNLYILNPEVVNNDGIYNLLTKKYHEAESKDIKVNISFLLDLRTLKMKIYEFARILGILLDNAIEASSECSEKIINLTFRNDRKNSRQLIIIENTYNNKEVDTEKIFEKGISGKADHTGLGLWEVRKIVKKNNNCNLHTSKTDKFFSQQLELYYE